MSLRTIAIVGRGAFGSFLARALPAHFPGVQTRLVAGRSSERALRAALGDAQAVVLAVPIPAYEEVVPRVARTTPPEAVIVDVATVKHATQTVMRRVLGKKRKWISLHPMFGPYSYEARGKQLAGLTVVVTGHTLAPREVKALRAAARRCGLVVKSMGPKTHDRLLARTLFLTHYLAQVVKAAGFTRTPIDTVSFGFLMQAVESVRDDTQLFTDVYRYNPSCEETIAAFEEAEHKVHRLLRASLREALDERRKGR